ncbi:prepilin peptidase [Primorskyibacter flagellatus]|uniref:prepilin peptidase n=1 Tax=Primorskyibacter flagellatus TaxID=1387277 RepID=UPI0027E5B4ED|nr:prepilin peptidase [Primorskyibacter flagellatus]
MPDLVTSGLPLPPIALDPVAAIVFLPFAALIGLYVAWSDLRGMRIPNGSVVLLALVYVLLGPLVLPLDVYGGRLVHLVVMLIAGMVLTALRVMGAGDAKFIAAAAPFVAMADLMLVMVLFTATLVAAFVTHRAARRTALRRLAPDWESWSRTKEFPMGTALTITLTIYLALAALD